MLSPSPKASRRSFKPRKMKESILWSLLTTCSTSIDKATCELSSKRHFLALICTKHSWLILLPGCFSFRGRNPLPKQQSETAWNVPKGPWTPLHFRPRGTCRGSRIRSSKGPHSSLQCQQSNTGGALMYCTKIFFWTVDLTQSCKMILCWKQFLTSNYCLYCFMTKPRQKSIWDSLSSLPFF